jgi:hypothetical protein
MEKFIKIGASSGGHWDSFYHIMRGDRADMVKWAAAGSYHPRIERYLATEPFTRRDLVLVVVPLGAHEAWGCNVNGDAFQQEQIEPAHRDWGHESFVHHANAFVHHQNKDPQKGFGKVPIAVFEPVMRRIEAVFKLDRDKADRVGAGTYVRKLDEGGSADLSMGCFPAGTLVTMADGTQKPIETVVVGDLVLTSTGRAQRVTSLHPREYEGPLLRIKVFGQIEVRVTPEHPFWATPRSSVIKNRRWVGKEDGAQWVHAKCLQEGDYLTTPVLQEVLTPSYASPALARLLGYYLAEGHVLYNKKGEYVGIELAVNRMDAVLDEIESLCRDFGSRNAPAIRPRTNSKHALAIQIFDPHLAELCFNHCGSYARHKRLSEDVMWWDPELQRQLIGAYINGDGGQLESWQPGAVVLSTLSDHLAAQIPQLLFRCGVKSNTQLLRHESGGGFNSSATFEHQIYIGKHQVPSLLDVARLKMPELSRDTNPGAKLEGGLVFSKLREISTEFFQGTVFNFEVEEDESYVVEGLAVHNCKVPYDICSICGQESKSVANYCTCLKDEMLKIEPDGRIHCAYNPRPRFFDLSIVIVRAAKEAAILEKAAAAGMVMDQKDPVDWTTSSFSLDDDSGLYLTKAASAKEADTKLAEIEKKLPEVFHEMVWPMIRSEEALPESLMDRLSDHTLPKSLASTSACGIVLRPREFQRLYLRRTGRPEMAEELHKKRCIFSPRDSRHAYRLQSDDIEEKILPLLHDLLPKRSVFQPFVSKRIIIVRLRGERPTEPELVEKTSEALDEVGEEYAKYINGLARLPSLLKSAMVRHGDLYDAFAAESYDPMRKVAGSLASIVGAGVGVVLPVYLMASKWRADATRGYDPGLLKGIVADYPATTSIGVLTGLRYLGKRGK